MDIVSTQAGAPADSGFLAISQSDAALATSPCRLVEDRMDALLQLHPSWFDDYVLAAVWDCDRATLVGLMRSAPDELLMGNLYAVHLCRLQLSHAQAEGHSYAGAPVFEGPVMSAMQDLFAIGVAVGSDEWLGQFEAVDLYTCPRESVDDLLLSAPTDFIRGYLYSTLNARLMLQAASL